MAYTESACTKCPRNCRAGVWLIYKKAGGATRAENRFIRAVKRANGRDSYIPTTIQHHDHGAWRDIDLADYAV